MSPCGELILPQLQFPLQDAKSTFAIVQQKSPFNSYRKQMLSDKQGKETAVCRLKK
jgi:hypothetical protein